MAASPQIYMGRCPKVCGWQVSLVSPAFPAWGRLRYEKTAFPITSKRIHAYVKKRITTDKAFPLRGRCPIGADRAQAAGKRAGKIISSAPLTKVPERRKKGSQPRLAALGSPFQGKGLAWTLPPSYGRRCPEGAEVGWGKRDEKERGRSSQAGNLRKYPSAAGAVPLPQWGRLLKLATPISNGGLFGPPPGFCTDTCLWQV